MTLSKLEELYKECRTSPNYRLKDLPEDQFLVNAKKSFEKLSDVQQRTVIKWYAKELGVENLSLEQFEKLLKYRYLSQTNLYFLCHLLEKYNQTTINTHEEICNAFFVQKEPNYATFEKFANQYTDLKDRLLLVSRGGFKSSIDMADCVQWIICFPAITILILTGTLILATDFVGEIKGHFTFEETGQADAKGKMVYGPKKLVGREDGEWSTSLFQVLFAEHCVAPNDGKQTEFQTPAGRDEKEPTIRASSIEQALSGAHYCVMKLDDVVTNENSQTTTRIEAVNKQISINRAMLHPYGFFDLIGTWYDVSDIYGKILKQEETLAKEEGRLDLIKGSIDSGRFNSSVYTKVYLRAAWWPTEKAIREGRIENEMKAEDYELWFPERLTYKFLSTEKKIEKSSGGFEIKYLNNPRGIGKVKFPKELLIRRTIPHNQLPPQQGIIVSCVDAAYSVKQWADYTVIITAMIYGGRFYILNMKRGRFGEYELPQVIANVGYKWKPKRIAIEDSVGVKWMGRELRREMDKLRISIPVEYVSLGFGSKSRSKMMKSKPVARLLGDERMFFVNSCEGLSEIYDELEKFTGTSDDVHDDIVSALSLLAEQFGGYADMDARINSVNIEYNTNQQSKAMHDMIYGLGKYSRFNANNMIVEDNPVTVFEQNERASVIQTNYNDPLSDLMG